MKIIDSGIAKLRDPFMLIEDGVFYLYGTDWLCHRNSTGKLDSGWEDGVCVVDMDALSDFDTNPWAPEVHKYNGAYYMFTTYKSKATGLRGSVIFKADSPMGPFKPYSDGFVTPKEWSCIDATLHIDEAGQPWMVFVNEWVATDDKIGRFAVAKMSDDLKSLITEPKEIFRADSFSWTDYCVTDGCFLYRTEKGSLIMIWSNFIPGGKGYAVGIARSDNGKVDGNWSDGGILFSREKSGKYDGGHGMIFEWDGRKWLSIHSPNHQVGDRQEMPVFVELKEENDTLVCL